MQRYYDFIINCIKLRMINQSKQNFDCSFTKEQGTIIKMNKFMFQSQQQQSPIYKLNAKGSRTFGVNTSRVMVFDNSVQLIVPITHLIFSDVKPKHRQHKKYDNNINDDGLDQQNSAPYKSLVKDPITNKSQQKQIKNNFAHNKIYKSKPHKNMELKSSLNPQNIQTIKLNTKVNKIQQIININIKQMQQSQNIIKQSRKSNKKQSETFLNSEQSKPLVKKNFKISNPSTRLTQSKLAAKQEIMNQAKKMIQQPIQHKASRIGRIQKNKPDKTQQYSIQNIINSVKIAKNPTTVQSEQNSNTLVINIKTPVSKIKRALIQSQSQLSVTYSFPQQLFFTPNFNTPNDELKERMINIFSEIGQQPQIISIKKYHDRCELRNKGLFIIWNYDGSGYFGGWKGGEQILAESNKHGIGIEWSLNNAKVYQMYYGQFKDNKKEGYGILKNSNGQIFIGCFKNDQRWGWGKVYGVNNQLKYNGQFFENQVLTPELLN